MYRIGHIVSDKSVKCQKSFFRIILHRQTLDSIKHLAISLNKKYTKKSKNKSSDCEIYKIKLRMIYSFSKTVTFDDVLELFDIIISLLQKIMILDHFYYDQIVVATLDYIEKFLDS